MFSARILFLAIILCLYLSTAVDAGFLDNFKNFPKKFSDILPSATNEARQKGKTAGDNKPVVNSRGSQKFAKGGYTVIDENGDLESLNAYSGDKTKFDIKNRKLANKSLKLLAG